MRKTPILGIVLLLVLALAGCGSSKPKANGEAAKTAAQQLADAGAAAKQASSVRVSGSIVQNGQKIGLDLQLVRGKGSAGSLTLGTSNVGLVVFGGKVYIKGSDAFLTKYAGSAGAQLFHGRWLEFPATDKDFSDLTTTFTIDGLFGQLTSNHGKISKGKATTFHGQSALSLVDPANSGTLYIAATGLPYPLGVVGTGSNTGSVLFSDWNSTGSITAPKNAVDLSKLK